MEQQFEESPGRIPAGKHEPLSEIEKQTIIRWIDLEATGSRPKTQPKAEVKPMKRIEGASIRRCLGLLTMLCRRLRPGTRRGAVRAGFHRRDRKAGIHFKHSFGDATSATSSRAPAPAHVLRLRRRRLAGHLPRQRPLSPRCQRQHRPEVKGKLTNRLYRNNHDGTFTDVTEKAGVGGGEATAWPARRPTTTATAISIFMCSIMDRNILYHNNGDGTFTDVDQEVRAGPRRRAGAFPASGSTTTATASSMSSWRITSNTMAASSATTMPLPAIPAR